VRSFLALGGTEGVPGSADPPATPKKANRRW